MKSGKFFRALNIHLNLLVVVSIIFGSLLVTPGAAGARPATPEKQKTRARIELSVTDGGSPASSGIHQTYLPYVARNWSPAATTAIVTPEKGGELYSPDGSVRVMFAPGTVPEPIQVEYRLSPAGHAPPSRWHPPERSFALAARSLATGAMISEFLTYTAEITVQYDYNRSISGADLRLASLFYWHPEAKRWVRMPTLHRVDRDGNPVLWTRTSHLTEFAAMAPAATGMPIVVLDPDENLGYVTTPASAATNEWVHNLHTVLQLKTLLEMCGVNVILTVEDIGRYVPPGGHQLTRQERVELMNGPGVDVALTLAYNTHNGGVMQGGACGTEAWFASNGSFDSSDMSFAKGLLGAIASSSSLPNRGVKIGKGLSSYIKRGVTYAHVEVAFLTCVQDRQRIDGDWGQRYYDYDACRATWFAFPIYRRIMKELGLADCGVMCMPDDGLSVENKPRLAPPILISETFPIARINYAQPADSQQEIESTFREQQGEYTTTYPLEEGVAITEEIALPITSVIGISGATVLPELATVSPSSITVLMDVARRQWWASDEGINLIYRPIENAFFWQVYQMFGGIIPWDCEECMLPDVVAALEAGGCQGLCAMTAYLCAGIYQPEMFGAPDAQSIQDNGLFSKYVNYYQMIQVWINGTDIRATDFFNQTMERMKQPSEWRQNPDLLRLFYCPEDSCTCWGHVVLPYWVQWSDDNTMVMKVYDPNLPLDTSAAVTLDTSTGEWTYPLSPTLMWKGTYVNYIRLSEFPPYGTSISDVIGSQSIMYTDGGSGYKICAGVARFSYGVARFSYGIDQYGNKIGVEYDENGNVVCHRDEIPGAQAKVPNYGVIPGKETRPPQVFKLPKGNYRFVVGEPRVGQVAAATLFGSDFMYTFNATAREGGESYLDVNEDLSVITHSTNMTDQVLSSAIYRETDDWTRIFGVSRTPLLAGEKVAFRASEKGNFFEYVNQGITKTYDLGLAQVSGFGVTKIGITGIVIGSGDRHVIAPWDWDNLENTLILLHIDHGNDGSIDETIVLRDNRPTSPVYVGPHYTTTDTTYMVGGETRIGFHIDRATCGLGGTLYRLDSGAWMTFTTPFTLSAPHATTHTLSYHSFDRVLNQEPPNITAIHVYTTRPTTVYTLSGDRRADGSYGSAVTVTLRGSSYLSDVVHVAPHRTEYRLNGGPWTNYEKPFVVDADRLNVLEFHTVDAAGYAEEPQVLPLEIDRHMTTLVPMGIAQEATLRNAYKAMLEQMDASTYVRWTASAFSHGGQTYPPGTFVVGGAVDGYYTHTVVMSESLPITSAYAMRRPHVAILKDDALWEYSYFEAFFRNYLGHSSYFVPLATDQITPTRLTGVDVLIIPAVAADERTEFMSEMDGRLSVISDFVRGGGSLIAFGHSTLVAQKAGLVPGDTVSTAVHVSSPNGKGTLHIAIADDPLAYSWISTQTMVMDDPLLSANQVVTAIAVYSDTNQPGSAALLAGRVGRGEVVLIGGHPILDPQYYPVVLNAILRAGAERGSLRGRAVQTYGGLVSLDTIPAYLSQVPISVTHFFQNNAPYTLTNVMVYDVIQPGLTGFGNTSPTPVSTVNDGQRLTVTWQMSSVGPGQAAQLGYIVHTLTDTMRRGMTTVSEGWATFVDPGIGITCTTPLNVTTVRAVMGANVLGDRDIEPDITYRFSKSGMYADVFLPLDNKNETTAYNITITDVVPLVSVIADIRDLNMPLTDPSAPPGTVLLARNEVYFYNNPVYPLPEGVSSYDQVLDISAWDGKTFYTVTVSTNWTGTITLPQGCDCCTPIFDGRIVPLDDPSLRHIKIVQNTDGTHLVLPALKLVWHYGTLPEYDYQEPAIRYGVHSQEMFRRALSFKSAPRRNTLVLDAPGASVLTHLGDRVAPTFHVMLFSNWQEPVFAATDTSRYTYSDVWGRVATVPMRTAFYNIIPPSFADGDGHHHLAANVTYDLLAERDGQWKEVEVYNTRDPEVQARVRVNIVRAGTSDDPYKALLMYPSFRGLGYWIEPYEGNWEASIDPGAATFITATTVGANDYVYLDVNPGDQIVLRTRVGVYDNIHYEGRLKLSDGPILVYHHPSGEGERLEFFMAHPIVPAALSSDVLIDKEVYPVRVRTYSDTVYYVLEIQDPFEPRLDTDDVYIRSIGYGDFMATTTVGGRREKQLFSSRVYPGEGTIARVELVNNTGRDYERIEIVPTDVPSGFQIVTSTFNQAILPFWYDLPYLYRSDLPHGRRSIWYYDVHVSGSFPNEERGQRHEIALEARLWSGGQMYTYKLPPIVVGVKDDQGEVQVVWGPATQLRVSDHLPSYVQVQTATIATEAQAVAFENAVLSGTQESVLASLTPVAGMTVGDDPDYGGHRVRFILPPYAQQLPWSNEGKLTPRLFLIVKAHIAADQRGTVWANYAPEVEWTDFEQVERSVRGEGRTVEAYGATLHVTVSDAKIAMSNTLHCKLIAGETHLITLPLSVTNDGDVPAKDVMITITIPTTGTLISHSDGNVQGNKVIWTPGTMGPGASRHMTITVSVTPSDTDVGNSYAAIASVKAGFTNMLPYPYAPFPVHARISDRIAYPVIAPCGWPGCDCY